MYRTAVVESERPRDVNAFQAASILYGDWGTSKAYVLGLAFALAGYSAGWLIAAVSILNVLLGLNYITICRCYPSGGGVYASVRRRSEILALVGGFFLVADYVVTASLSALSAFQYLAVPYPEYWAIAIIAAIGLLNCLGPRHTGNMALAIALPTVIIVIILGILSVVFFKGAVSNIQPLQGGFEKNWIDFVSIIVALSGIEAIANSTGVMKLDPGSTPGKPLVTKTATPAILVVMFEVVIFTTLFGFAMSALPGLVTDGVEVNAPDYPNVRDSMLRYMGQEFTGKLLGTHVGYLFGLLISITFCVLLLSAVNTAIVALISLLYVMSKDGQLPRTFQNLNSHGVPKIPLYIATATPIVILLLVNNIVGLANLYAVGFVGAIATNLGSTSTDFKLEIDKPQRIFMFATFLIMAAIEISLFIYKPDARTFVVTILAIGLILRGLVLERKFGVKPSKTARPTTAVTELTKEKLPQATAAEGIKKPLPKFIPKAEAAHMHNGAMLCAVFQKGKALEFALQECERFNQPLYVLFIREEKVTMSYGEWTWLDDKQACEAFDIAVTATEKVKMSFLYAVSAHAARNIVTEAKNLNVSRVIMSMPRRNKLLRLIQGDIVEDVREHLPMNIDLLVVS